MAQSRNNNKKFMGYPPVVRSPPHPRKMEEEKFLAPDLAKIRGLGDTKLPQIEWSEPFPALSRMNDDVYEQLAIASISLLDYLKMQMHPEMSLGFRIELQPTKDNQWKMVLRISSVVWFDRHLTTLTNGADAAKICRDYIQAAREKIRNTPVPDPSDVEPILDSVKYCQEGDDCTRRNKNCLYRHSIVWCGTKATRPDGAERRCGWRVNDDRLINRQEVEDCKTKRDTQNLMVVYARADPIRDVIVAPFNHTTNAQMVKSPKFWKAVLNILNTYFNLDSPELIYLNFGVWETQTAEDTRAADCHAHAHINLTRKAVDTYGKNYTALQGRINNPEDYLQKECDSIESRLNGLEIGNLGSEVKTLGSEVKTLSVQVTEIQGTLKTILGLLQGEKPTPANTLPAANNNN